MFLGSRNTWTFSLGVTMVPAIPSTPTSVLRGCQCLDKPARDPFSQCHLLPCALKWASYIQICMHFGGSFQVLIRSFNKYILKTIQTL